MKTSIFSIIYICLLAMALCACSSAKNKAMFVTDIHSRAAKEYDAANKEISQGNFEEAERLLESSYNMATSIDDIELLSRICIAKYNLKLLYSDEEEKKEAEKFLIEAKEYAFWSENDELLYIISIFEARGAIKLEKDSLTLKEYITKLDKDRKKLSKSPFYLALSYRTSADLYFKTEDYSFAASLYEKAALIHTKNRDLDEIGLNWYYAAISYSKAGEKEKGLESIQNALKYDKDAENISAIIADYKHIQRYYCREMRVQRKRAKPRAQNFGQRK